MTRPTGPWSDYIHDYVTFHRMELASGDVDPVYRVLQRMNPTMNGREMALLSFLHVAYYDFGSALRAWGVLGGRADPKMVDRLVSFPCGTERRGMRDPKQLHMHLTHLLDIDQTFDGLDRWAIKFPTYGELSGALQSIYGNGRWAAYKTTELLSWSMRPYWHQAGHWEPIDMGHAHSSGPRHGLQLLWAGPLPYGHDAAAVRKLDEVSSQLVRYLNGEGARASMATAETTLCDFNSLVKGRYYPGHDIHQLGDQLRRAWTAVESNRLLVGLGALKWGYDAAVARFGDEVNQPVDLARKKLYKATGRLT